MPCDEDDFSDVHIKRLASSNAEKRAVREAVFNGIVALSRERILSRMRSDKYKASGRKERRCFVGALLRGALNTPWRQRASKIKRRLGMTESDLDDHERRIQGLLEAMEAFEASNHASQQLHASLAGLVHEIARFKQHTPFRDLLATLTDVDMLETSRERLLSCLDKIARYREVAKFLCRRAEVLPLLQAATIKSLELPAEAFARPTGTAYNGTVYSVLQRLSTKEAPIKKSDLSPWLQKALDATPSAKFMSNISQTLQESKIHAEIQILAYFEDDMPATGLRPRVIASSKNACYLCHTFFNLHGQYRVPKTHGKLYRRWRLPAMPTLSPLQQHLNEFLEQQVRLTVGRLRRMGQFPRVAHHNESTLSPLTVSASVLSGMGNLSIASNHSRLDLTTPAPAIHDPSHVTLQVLGTRISSVPLRLLHNRGAEVGESAPRVAGHDSNEEQHSQKDLAITPASSQMDSILNTERAHGVVDQAKSSNVTVCALTLSTPPALDHKVPSHSADKSVKATSSLCSQVETNENPTIFFDPSSADDDSFVYKNLEVFIDNSSAKFSYKRLSKSEAVVASCSNARHVQDVRSLASGLEITLPKGPDGNVYLVSGEEAVMIDTRRR